MRPKTYHVTLTQEDRDKLLRLSQSYRHSERERKRARILLLADETQEGGSQPDKTIATQVKVCLPTVGAVRQRFALRGLKATIYRKEQQRRKARVLDGEAEAHLIALVCSAPPEGRKCWSLHLLKNTLIEQQVTDSVSHETVRQTLKKMNLNLG